MRLISRNREAATGELHAVRRNHDHVRKDSPDHQKARGGDGQFARTECGSTARLLPRSRCEPSRVPVKGSATALPHTRQTCATSFNHPHDAVHTTLSQLFNFLHAAPTARFRRVVLTARQSLPVYPDKQQFQRRSVLRGPTSDAHRISSSAKSQVARINPQNESPARHLLQ